MVPYAMRHYDRESRAETRSPAVWCCSWASAIRARQGVGSKNLLLLFVSVHFLYSWLLPAVQGSKEAKGGIVKDILLCNRKKKKKRKGIRLRACSLA